jgi:hypothetical protein
MDVVMPAIEPTYPPLQQFSVRNSRAAARNQFADQIYLDPAKSDCAGGNNWEPSNGLEPL